MRTRVIWFFLCLIASPALFASGGGGGGGGGSAMSATPAAPQLTAQQWYSQGYTAAKSGKYAEAITDFKEAVNLQPNYPEALNMEGYSLRKAGKVRQAFAYYEKALSLRPDFADAREYYGEASLQGGDLKKAVQQYLILQKAQAPQAQELLAWIDATVNNKTPPAEDLGVDP